MDGFYGYYDYDSDGGESWDDTPVDFLRPDGETEGKNVQWCLDNGFFEIEEGLWSGKWYYEAHPEEKRFHSRRLKRTQEIRERGEHRRARIGAQRQRQSRMDELQEAALMSVLLGDISRQRRVPVEEVLARYGADVPLGPFGAGDALGASAHYRYPGTARGDATQPGNLSRSSGQEGKNNSKYPKGSEEDIEARKQRILESVVNWAEGDQEIVDRSRAALKGTDHFLYKCPCKGCKSHFPTQEIAKLHARNASGKAHNRYRREAGLPDALKAGSVDYSTYVKCASCVREFKSQELADFHFKNDPCHRRHRIEKGMDQEWDHDAKEKFHCPVCQRWFLSTEKMEEHLQTQSGKAHDRYRHRNEQADG